MDNMDLEREKGITIASAATFATWKTTDINIIDTPGHVDFTIEVERALRVLDGAVLVLCSVSGVQSQTITVDRQMRRYNVPRIAFVNKCDRPGADPEKICSQIRTKLRHNAAMIQIPIGLEAELEGVVDIIDMQAIYFDGYKGEDLRYEAVPAHLVEKAVATRQLLIEALADVNEEVGELFLMEEEIDAATLKRAIRQSVIDLSFVPVMMGSALKNNGIQPLLDGVVSYLPNPEEVTNIALDPKQAEAEVKLDPLDLDKPFVGLAFKIDKGKFGQLTYMRTYQGVLKRGDFIVNSSSGGKKVKVPRLVRMHSDEMVDVEQVNPGEICALFGVDCSSGDTFCAGSAGLTMESMFVPEAVMSLSFKPKNQGDLDGFGKGLTRFMQQDPTFRVHVDDESKETIVSGMGELHLDIYRERLLREYGCETIVGKPKVAYRETITQSAKFDFIHKKQSGGSGQYGRVIGEIMPVDEEDCEDEDERRACTFEDETVGQNISKSYVPAIQKGFLEQCLKGPLVGSPIEGVVMKLYDGAEHAVDSSEMAFVAAGRGAMREAVNKAGPQVLQPIMRVEISVPLEFQGNVIGGLNKRKGAVLDSETAEGYCTILANVPLNDMFGYSNELRASTQGKGEFQMEFTKYEAVLPNDQAELMKAYQKERSGKN
jgi:elongation factor G